MKKGSASWLDVEQLTFGRVQDHGVDLLAASGEPDPALRGQLAVQRRVLEVGGEQRPGQRCRQPRVIVGQRLVNDQTNPFESVQSSDVVITMGCGDACPIYPGKRYEDWPLDDPAGQGVEAVRPIRDAIRQRVVDLLASLDVPAGSSA